jgi:hypothetical protein
MPKMTRAQAKKRLNEARAKVKAVYMQPIGGNVSVTTGDMHAIDKIIEKCLKRLN